MTDQTSVELASVELVPVGADTLSVLRQDGVGWLVLKPACEALGIDVQAQQRRLERTPWATTAMMAVVGADGRQREMYCLRTDRVAMWLATIETSRIADPEARKRLERWQCNAAEALDRWFRGPNAPASAPPAASISYRQDRQSVLGTLFCLRERARCIQAQSRQCGASKSARFLAHGIRAQ